VANADSVYVDPSALIKLYLNEPESRAMAVWRTRLGGTIAVTHHGRVEVVNALGLAVHRGKLTPDALEHALQAFEDDFAGGRLRQADLLWRATFTRAAELSRRHARTIGVRSLDVLHVASALELGLRHFATFDERQQNLARAAGLRPVVPG
jgi:predicted nucleic acid-binding protein